MVLIAIAVILAVLIFFYFRNAKTNDTVGEGTGAGGDGGLEYEAPVVDQVASDADLPSQEPVAPKRVRKPRAKKTPEQ